MQNINKSFYGVNVLSDINFDLLSGEVHALVGQNGAGKSTLINIISGVYQPDNGKILVKGKEVTISSTFEAHKYGISTIHQVPNLIPYMNIIENIFLGMEPKILKIFNNFYRMKMETERILDLMGSTLDPYALVGNLNMSEQFIVAIARAFLLQPQILIMDEPTAGLSEIERENLFNLTRKLKDKGTGIIYITHALSDLPRICDRITVIRDGNIVATCNIKEVTQNNIVKLMGGREIKNYFPPIKQDFGREILRVENLVKKPYFENISFNLHEGEILGFAGLVGSGRSCLAKTIFGEIKRDSGYIYWHNRKVNFNHPHEAIRKGLGLLSENRYESGLFMNMGVSQNLTISNLEKIKRWEFIKFSAEQDLALDKIVELDIKICDLKQQIKCLSGGNQQKTVLGRWLIQESDIYILDEPTRGIDIISRSDLYVAIRNLVDQGKGVIIISSDVTELMGLCSRIIVMNQGSIVDEMSYNDISEARILKAMAGTSHSNSL